MNSATNSAVETKAALSSTKTILYLRISNIRSGKFLSLASHLFFLVHQFSLVPWSMAPHSNFPRFEFGAIYKILVSVIPLMAWLGHPSHSRRCTSVARLPPLFNSQQVNTDRHLFKLIQSSGNFLCCTLGKFCDRTSYINGIA